ncbi:MAG: NAD-glutamate dehydrogenase [Bowdeniella nasicola]|nr:NAD-glutamate dehydrogenase [Bowdeniella nasicola]
MTQMTGGLPAVGKQAAELCAADLPETLDSTALIAAIVHTMGPEDIAEISAQELAAEALAFVSAAGQRAQNQDVVTIAVAENARPRLQQILVITDDMPFLVDSLTLEIERQGLLIHSLTHPQIAAQRDDTGALIGVGGDTSSGAEAWMCFTTDMPDDAAAQAALENGLREVLADVRAAVTDWQPMEQRARDLAAELRANPPAGQNAVEAANLLEWLANGHFTFLGARSYRLLEPEADHTHAQVQALEGTGLGILRTEGPSPIRDLPAPAAAKAREKQVLIVTKINRPSTVHRAVPLDYIGVKIFDDQGIVVGEHRFIGLFTYAAYQESVFDVPVVRSKVTRVLEQGHFDPEDHMGRDVLAVLEDYPRDELFQIPTADLADIAAAVVHLPARRRTRVFVRRDPYQRFASCMVFMPRDRYTRSVRARLEKLMVEAFQADDVSSSAFVSAAALARVHLTVWGRRRSLVPDVDGDWLQQAVEDITRSVDEDAARILADDDAAAAAAAPGEQQVRNPEPAPVEATAPELLRIVRSLPETYKDEYTGAQAVRDARELAAVQDDIRVRLHPDTHGDARLYLYSPRELTLSEVLPILTHFGLTVVDEKWYRVEVADRQLYLHSLGVQGEVEADATERFERAFSAVLAGEAEDDGFNALVFSAGLHWSDVVVLRALASYAKQTIAVYSKDYVVSALVANPSFARALVDLFALRFDPQGRFGGEVTAERQDAFTAAAEQIRTDLDGVPSLDHDRIIRGLLTIIEASVRTNRYTASTVPATLAIKVIPGRIPDMPQPRPRYEIWVHGPRVEGVHLRFGKVARGGLRWSDRREDFRTEVLGLVKAQMVKNAVIVPTGSKGGFVPLQLPDPSVDRAAWLAEGTAAYVAFISALLSVTDNRTPDGEVVAPTEVVRWDDDDPYLVVAADKGTAAFSDTANKVAREHDFWLDDAFASGGSAGYDHKKMGITARGAWESVKRHFREMGHDTQSEDFTVVGIGDMSGDVFGNGMLLSEHIRLVGAFNHQHIFVDPNPDAATSYAERKRLFELPRSSWEDYDRALISEGGGIFARSAKSVEITPQMRQALGLSDDVASLSPAELIRALLCAPADLLWNGGIGTYVRASDETNEQIGDKANDTIRITGKDLRVRVVGEGGNLGCSQRGRIEAAQNGVHINTDAIDNSGGVDSSDLEVNIKILLQPIVASGRLTVEERNALLEEMTDEVATLVLRQNYEQNALLGNARYQDDRMLGAHMRLMEQLEESGELDRELEFLPSTAELEERAAQGHGLVSPEFAVLVAYAKMSVKDQLLATSLPDEPWTQELVAAHFPRVLAERFGEDLRHHRLRREIVVTELANSIINRGGITFVSRAMDETGASADQIVAAYQVAREVFNLADFTGRVEALDAQVDTDVQSELYLTFRRMLDRAVRWLVHNRPGGIDVPAEIGLYRDRVEQLVTMGWDIFPEASIKTLSERVERLTSQGVDEALAQRASWLINQVMLLDVIEAADASGADPVAAARIHFELAERLGVYELLRRVRALPQTDRWDALARAAMRGDATATLAAITREVLMNAPDGLSGATAGAQAVDSWLADHAEVLSRVDSTMEEIFQTEHVPSAALSVALRQLRSLVRSA